MVQSHFTRLINVSRCETVGYRTTRRFLSQRRYVWILSPVNHQTLGWQTRQEIAENPAYVLEVGVVALVVQLQVRNQYCLRLQEEKGAVRFICLADQEFSLPVTGVRSQVIQLSPHQEGGIHACVDQNAADHGCGSSLAMSSTNSQASPPLHEPCQRLGPFHHRNPALLRLQDFLVGIWNGGRDDNSIRVVNVGLRVSQDDRYSGLFQAVNVT